MAVKLPERAWFTLFDAIFSILVGIAFAGIATWYGSPWLGVLFGPLFAVVTMIDLRNK